jgi:hypothetical protein
VLAPGLVIHKIYNGYWFWGRPSPDELRQDLREVTRAIRPDWDLAAPGLRQAWQAGDRSRHYPYRTPDPSNSATPGDDVAGSAAQTSRRTHAQPT